MTMGSAADVRPLHSALIVDDHPLFCDALSMTLKSVAGIRRSKRRTGWRRRSIRVDLMPAPDAIVLDLDLPDVNGIDGLIRLRRAAGPGAGAGGVLSGRQSGDRRRLAAGAAGFDARNIPGARCSRAAMTLRAGATSSFRGAMNPSRGGKARAPRGRAIGQLSLLTQ